SAHNNVEFDNVFDTSATASQLSPFTSKFKSEKDK
ncbi:MAG: hypothetical protein ACI9XO_005003, partial [Paraglaciecola sp.]